MDVLAVLERFAKRFDLSHVGQKAQLDLRIVGRNQLVTWFGDKGGTDFPAFFASDRDVLQVRIVG